MSAIFHGQYPNTGSISAFAVVCGFQAVSPSPGIVSIAARTVAVGETSVPQDVADRIADNDYLKFPVATSGSCAELIAVAASCTEAGAQAASPLEITKSRIHDLKDEVPEYRPSDVLIQKALDIVIGANDVLGAETTPATVSATEDAGIEIYWLYNSRQVHLILPEASVAQSRLFRMGPTGYESEYDVSSQNLANWLAWLNFE